MPQIDFPLPSKLPTELAELIELAPLPGLSSSPKCEATAKRIRKVLSDNPQLAGTVTEAAIWLLAGELDRSHEVSQSLTSAEGSYWHGIMHRREGDFWNAKYWFRKVGEHPVFEQLAAQIARASSEDGSGTLPTAALYNPTKLAAALVDECERVLASQSDQAALLQRYCWFEWQFLFHNGWD